MVPEQQELLLDLSDAAFPTAPRANFFLETAASEGCSLLPDSEPSFGRQKDLLNNIDELLFWLCVVLVTLIPVINPARTSRPMAFGI